MWRPVISPRILVLTVAASAGAGIGLGALSAYSTEASHPTATVPAAARLAPPFTPATSGTTSTTSTTGTGAAPGGAQAPTSPLTADQASAIAVQASPGTVVEVKQDNEAGDPTEANDPNEATDPNEPAETAEPTGLEYKVTVQHSDGTATKVTVDGTTGQVVSTEQKDDSGS